MNTLNCHIAAQHPRDDALPADGQLDHPAHAEPIADRQCLEDIAFTQYHKGFAAGFQWAFLVGFCALVISAALLGAFGRWMP